DIRPMPVRDLTSPHNPTGRGNRLTGSLTGTVHQNGTQVRGSDESPARQPQPGFSSGNRTGNSVVVLGGRNRNQDRVATGSNGRDAARGNLTGNPRQAGTAIASLPPQQTDDVPAATPAPSQPTRPRGNGSGWNNNNNNNIGSRPLRGWQNN